MSNADKDTTKPTTTKPTIRISDYDNPNIPFPLKCFNTIRDLCPSRFPGTGELLSLATEKSGGLTNFGDVTFYEPMEVLVNSLQTETPLTAFGRFIQKETIVNLLVGRLRLEELYRLHPEIEDEEIESPIIISGLPRTGTTHLFNLLSRDTSLDWMPYWETLEPFPPINEIKSDDSSSRRMNVGKQGLQLIDWIMPEFPAFHKMPNDLPHEELNLLAGSFISLYFECVMLVPSYSKWYSKTADRSPAYRYLKRCLKALQYLRHVVDSGGQRRRRWLLKCPEHMMNVTCLMKEFPNATFVQTHRDPVRIVASMSALVAYTSRMSGKGNCNLARDMARHWSARGEELIRLSIEHRHLLPKEQIVDVYFDDFMGDMLGTVKRIYKHADQPYTIETEQVFQKFLADNPKGKHGIVDYRAAMIHLGIEYEERRQALSFYSEHFKVKSDFSW